MLNTTPLYMLAIIFTNKIYKKNDSRTTIYSKTLLA